MVIFFSDLHTSGKHENLSRVFLPVNRESIASIENTAMMDVVYPPAQVLLVRDTNVTPLPGVSLEAGSNRLISRSGTFPKHFYRPVTLMMCQCIQFVNVSDSLLAAE